MRRLLVLTNVGDGWELTVDEGPEWLFFRLRRSDEACDLEPPLAEAVWQTVEDRGPRRLVFELDDGTLLSSFLVGQLVLLHKRAEMARGAFRVCGLSEHSLSTLHMMGLESRFPNYRSREDAVMGRLG